MVLPDHGEKMKRNLIFVGLGIVIALAVALFAFQPAEKISPLELLTLYQPVADNYPFPEFITENLPDNFHPGVPTEENVTYHDNTPVTIRVLGYSNGEGLIVAQVLSVCGEPFVSNTPEIENYSFKVRDIGGHTVIWYAKDNTQGYVWYHGPYSLIVFDFTGTTVSYLENFVDIYVNAYPPTF